MTKKNKKLNVGLLGVALAMTLAGGISTLPVKADSLDPNATEFGMEMGARARLDGTGEYSGIRFTSYVSEAWYNEIVETYPSAQNITFGMLIAPTRDLTNGLLDLTLENKEALKAENIVKDNISFEAGSMELRGSITYSKTELEADYEAWKQIDITEEQATELLEKTYDLELVGRAYCTFVENGRTHTYYAVENDNARTVREIMNAHDIKKPTELSENEKKQFLDDVKTATAYADEEGDVVFDIDTPNRLYIGAKANELSLDNGYVSWPELVTEKNIGDTLTVSSIVDGKITRINVSVIDDVMTDESDLSALNNTNEAVNVKKYALGKNLNASAVAMAHDNNAGAGFGGLFDGMGHSISNLNIGSGTGIFGEFVNGATIQNLALLNVTVNKGFYFSGNSAVYTMKNVYVKVSKESQNPRGISLMNGSQVIENVIVEYTGANAVKVPTSNNYTGWDCFGVLYGGYDVTEDKYAVDTYAKDVYVISPSLLVYSSLLRRYIYGANEKGNEDIWGRTIGDGATVTKYTLADDEVYYDAISNKEYYDIPMNHTYHYDSYTAMASANNDLSSFDSKYWFVSNNAVYWKGAYANQVEIVVTDATGAETDSYIINPNNTSLTVSLRDSAKIENTTYTVTGADSNLLCSENGVLTIADTYNSDTDTVYTVTATAGNVSKSIQVTVSKTISYNQKVTLSTLDNTYDFGETNFTLENKTILKAYINDEEIAVNDGALPVISMKYYKDFSSQSWGNAKGRVTYMDIFAGETLIVDNKAEDTSITLKLETADGSYIFNNLMVYTKVIKTAKDLEIFNHLGLNYGGIARTGYYVLGNNIDATATDIFHDYDEGIAFTGTFDGQGYTISNLDVSETAVESTAQGKKATSLQTGLFGVIEGGCVKNVGFVNVNAQNGAVLGKVLYKESTFGDDTLIQGTNKFFGSVFENIYIQVASTVTQMQGMLASVADIQHVTKSIIIEYNPTTPATQTNGYGSFIGSLNYESFQQGEWTKENLFVMSSVAVGYFNNAAVVAKSWHLTYRTDRKALISDHPAYTLDSTYWTTTSGAPVWNTANWQSAN